MVRVGIILDGYDDMWDDYVLDDYEMVNVVTILDHWQSVWNDWTVMKWRDILIHIETCWKKTWKLMEMVYKNSKHWRGEKKHTS